MNKQERLQHQYFTSINDRNYTAVFDDIVVPKGHIAGYAIIAVIGEGVVPFLRGMSSLSPATVIKLKAMGYRVCGKTGITTCNRTSDRAISVIGAITRNKKAVSSYVEKVHAHLAENINHQAFHLVFGVDCRPGERKIHETIIEAEIAKNIMEPLGVELLNAPGSRLITTKFKRKLEPNWGFKLEGVKKTVTV